LKRTDGSFADVPHELEAMVVGFFEELYKMEHSVRPDLMLDLVDLKVTEAMNIDLYKYFLKKKSRM
jgi:hypothetical protein